MKDIEDFKDEWRNEADSEMKTYMIRAERNCFATRVYGDSALQRIYK